MEAASLRIFARAVNHRYVDQLPSAHNTGHLRLNILSLVLRLKTGANGCTTCLQSMLDLFQGRLIQKF